MMRGLQPYANHNRSESHKYNQKSLAKTTALETGGKLNIQAREGDIRAQGSRISAEGDAQFIAAQNVDFGVAVHEQSQQASSRKRGVGIDGLAKYVVGGHTQRENGDTRLSQEVGSQISIAGNSTTIAEKGDVTLKGTTFVSGGKNRLQANEGNVKLMTAETTDNSVQVRKGHGVGEAVISDTERFFGYNRTRMNQDGDKVSHDGSQLASLNNKVEVYAGKDYQQTASEVLAKEKVDINAQNITINNALNHQENSYSESDLKIGQFSRIKSPIIDLINTIEGAVKNDKASDRLKAANAMSIAAQGYNLYNSISKLKDPKSGTYLFRAESGSGIAHSRQSQEGLSDISQGSRINAKEINLVARGDGSLNEKGERKLGNINLTHAELTSRDETGKRLEDSRITLTGNELNIKAGENHTQFKGRNSSMGVEVGVAATVGAQTGVGIYARVGGSSGKEDGESKTYQSSQLNAETVTLNSQGDTNLIGSQVKGKTVNANVGGNLNIESLQDEEHFKTKSSGGGLEVEFGFGNNWSVSGYGNSEKGESHRKQVNEQAGIFAEEGGYHVDAKNVHLNGGAITGTNSQANELKTNSFTFADIQNESSSNAMSGSVSASAKGKGSKVNSTSFGGGLPINESDSDNSVTRATLSEGKITLNKDSEPTQTTAQALGINTDINQANSQVNAPKDVKQQLSEQRQISAAAGHIRDAVNTYMANQQKAAIKEMAALQAEREELVKRNDKVALAKVDEKLITLLKESEEWGNEGKYRRALDAITSAGVAALTGQSAQGIAVTAASPYVNQAIKNATTDEQTGKVNKVTNIAAHALWGAVEGNALGGSGTAGALSAAGAELVAPQIAKILYDKTPNELSASEKQRVIALSGVVGKAIGGITSAAKGDGTYTVSKNSDIGGDIAKNAVENNAIFKPRGENYLFRLQQIKKYPEAKNRLLQEMGAESVRNNGAIRSACEVNVAQCKQYIQMLKEARNYYIEEQTKHPEWTYSEEGKMLQTLREWSEYDLKMAQGILAEKPQVQVSRGVRVEGKIDDPRYPERNAFAKYRAVEGTNIGGTHLIGQPAPDRNHEKNMTKFEYYKRWVKDGIISPQNIPASVFKNLANEGRSHTDKTTGKVTKSDADFFYRLLIEDVKKGKVMSDKEYLNSIPNNVSTINKLLSANFTQDKSSVAYKFAKHGVDKLSISELKELRSLMNVHRGHRGALGDKIFSSNQALQYGLLKIGLEQHGLSSKTSGSDERNKLIAEMKHDYEIMKIPDKEVAKARKTIEQLDKVRSSAVAGGSYIACNRLGGSEQTCDRAITLGALAGDMLEGAGNVMGAKFDMKNITPTQPLHPYTPDSHLNPKKGSNSNVSARSETSVKNASAGLKNKVNGFLNSLNPVRRAEAKAAAEKRAQAIRDNNFYADQSGYGWDIHNLRTFEGGRAARAENVNASQVTDRDGLVRVGGAKINSDNDILASTGKDSLPYHPTGYPAWKEGTLVTDRRIMRPEMMRMVIDHAQYQAILDGKVALGNWATKEPINSISDMRKHLAITEEFKPNRINGKPNKFYVVEFEVRPGIGVREGTAGPMFDTVTNKMMPGGVKQINFIDGTPYTNPNSFKIDKNSIREIK